VTKKIRLGVLFGGRSGEHEVSLISAAAVMRALDPAKYELVPIGITREGRWRVGPKAFGLLTETAGEDAAQRTAPLQTVLEEGRAVTPSADPTSPKLLPLAKSSPTLKARPEVDVIFPVLHGTFGEDGTIQGLLELADVPYVGAGVLASSTGMDKDVMKRLFREAGLPVVPWELALRRDWENDPAGVRKRIEKRLRYPLFVKPANLGSSVGITKVHKPEGLQAAMDLAAQYDRKILVEKAIDAREIECAVLGNDNPEAYVPGEIIPVNEFYDYEAKYIKEGSALVIPTEDPKLAGLTKSG
jgi:D-alanine-D-alanine ligase